MKIKICGIQTVEDAHYLNESKVDFAGFIFAKNSKRFIDIEQAVSIKKALLPEIQTVGVFVNEQIENIIKIVNEEIIDLIQLHGNENRLYIEKLRNNTNKPIIKAYKADENLKNNIETSIADYVLIDSYDKTGFGGTGKTFDWSTVPVTNKKIFLAGGINITNVISAISAVKPYCIDINSGAETAGRKNATKIKEIVNIIRKYENIRGNI